jgi:hypothetical protein
MQTLDDDPDAAESRSESGGANWNEYYQETQGSIRSLRY